MNLEKLVKLNTYTVSFLIYLLVFPFISIVYKFLFLVLFFVSVYRDFFNFIVIKRIFLNISAIVSLVFMIFNLDLENIILPVIQTLLILLSIKLLEDKNFRDYMQIYLLITLIFSGYSLLSVSMVFLFYLITYIFLLNFSIVILTYYNEDPDISLSFENLKSVVIKSSIIPVIAVPLTTVLFFLLPRTSYPMFNILPVSSKAKTGFSDNITLGEVSSIQEDNQTVMRIAVDRYFGEIYIRGVTFNRFDGKRWENTVPDNIKTLRQFDSGKPITYDVYLEPTYQNYLFLIDFPIKLDMGKNVNTFYPYPHKDLTYTTLSDIDKKMMYRGYSILSDRFVEQTSIGYYLILPEKISKELVDYSKRFKDRDAYKTALNILKELSKLDYSLSNLPMGENQLDSFLFDKKKGNCEYFATGMAILLRLNGIPSRVVGGYKTSTYNNIGRYYLVKQKDAHLWTEAYISGKWIRFDPTPPIRNLLIQKIESPSKLKLIYDTFNYYYTVMILSYDFSKQMSVYKSVAGRMASLPKIEIERVVIKDLIYVIITLVTVLTTSVYIFRYYKRSYEERVIRLFLKKLQKFGYRKGENEGLEQFCSKIKEEELRERSFEIVRMLEKYIYGRERLDKNGFKKLKKYINGII